MSPTIKPLAISLGCPSGIGPEVALRAALAHQHPCVLVGGLAIVERALALVAPAFAGRLVLCKDVASMEDVQGALHVFEGNAPISVHHAPFGAPTPEAGRAQLAWVDAALMLVRAGHASAMVTGPVSKEAVVRGGLASFRGHTEYLQRALGAPEVVMAFWSPELVTALVTTHMPLSRVAESIVPEAVATAAYWLATLVHSLGDLRPMAVASLNPHAGEGGLLGHEESRIVAGMRLAQARLGRDVLVGPVPAETAFRKAHAGAYSAVVAMYHDQATIPMKLTGFGDAVNVSLGLPIVRTSVDHGTGYDIAGTGVADARGMIAAIDLAVRLVAAR